MKVSFGYDSDNSTESLNNMIRGILPKGVYYFPGSDVYPAINSWIRSRQNTAYIDILPGWVVRSNDGMTIREDSTTYSLVVDVAGLYYVGLVAEYRVAREPRLEIKAIARDVYDAWTQADKNSFIIFAEVSVARVDTTYTININIASRTFPRGVLALYDDLISGGSYSSLRVSDTFDELPVGVTTLQDNELAYIRAEGRLAIYLDGAAWVRIKTRADYQLNGTGVFSSTAAVDGGQVTINLPTADGDAILQHAYDNNAYQIILTPIGDGSRVGSWWIEKANASFIVKCTGSPVDVSFDWTMILKEFEIPISQG